MEWMPPPDGIKCVIVMFSNVTVEEKASMDGVSVVRLDLAKRVFQAHGGVFEPGRDISQETQPIPGPAVSGKAAKMRCPDGSVRRRSLMGPGY